MSVETVPSRSGVSSDAPPPRQERVARDMSAIFGEQRVTPLPRQRSLIVIKPAARRRRPIAAAAALLCLIGTAGVALFVGNQPRNAESQPAASAVQTDRIAAPAPVSATTNGPQSAGGQASVGSATAEGGAVPAAPTDPTRSAPSARAEPRPTPEAGPDDSGTARPGGKAKADKFGSTTRVKAGKATASATGSSAPLVEACSPTEPGCRLHGIVLAEDARLRDAYARAQAAGVRTATLTRYQRRWERLLKRAAEEPDSTLKGLRVMTQELIEETREAARRDAAR